MRMIAGALPFTLFTIVMSMPVAATAATPGEVCTGAKLKASGKFVAAFLNCAAKATKVGGNVDPNCTAKASTTLTTALAKAEARGGCAPGGDLPSALSTYSITFLLRPVSTANRCASSKIKAAGKKAKAKLTCHAKASARGLTVDPTCLVKAEARFAAVFAIAETRPPCLTTDDAPIIENMVDDLVADAVAAIPTGTTTTTTTTASTTTTFIPGICGNGVIDQPGEDCDLPDGSVTCVPGTFTCRAPGEPGECTCCGNGSCSYDEGVPCCDPFQTCVNGPGPLDACEACSPAGQACTTGPLGPGCCPGAVCIDPPGICVAEPTSTTTTSTITTTTAP